MRSSRIAATNARPLPFCKTCSIPALCAKGFNGKFLNVCQLNDPSRTNEERYLYLAGGIAAEQLEFNHYDREASENDQKLISELEGGKIESYISPATEIIRTHEACFRRFWERITIRLQEKRMAMIATGGSNSFKLLSSAEIQEIWLAYNQ